MSSRSVIEHDLSALRGSLVQTMGASPALIRKFEALRNRIEEALQRGPGSVLREHFADDEFSEWLARWEKIRTELVQTEDELSDLPKRQFSPQKPDLSERPYYHRYHVKRIADDMRDAWDVLTHPSRAATQVALDREGIFVAGQPFDAMLAVSSILRAATKEIVLVDNYISEKTLDVLTVKADTVVARVLTGTKQNSVPPSLVPHAQAFVSQYGGLEIRKTGAFHDRFILIDDVECFHFGASIKDAGVKNTFMFSRIQEPAVLATFTKTLRDAWTQATVVL